MNIKGVVGNLIPVEFIKRTERNEKTQSSQDRDPQQSGGGGKEPEQHRFTEEELKEAINYLKENPGIKSNNLQLRVEHNQSRVTVFVEDIYGKVVRRISDTELWAMVKAKSLQSERGALLNKAL